MTRHHDPKSSFNSQNYREAMGPGYGIATFKEQAELTGHSVSLSHRPSLLANRSVPSMRRPRLLTLRHRVLVRLDQLLERSRSVTQAQLANLEDAQPTPNCC